MYCNVKADTQPIPQVSILKGNFLSHRYDDLVYRIYHLVLYVQVTYIIVYLLL